MLNKLFVATVLVVLLFSGGTKAQDFKTIEKIEDSLLVTVDSMYHAFIPEDRVGHTERFIKQLIRALKVPNSYQYPFERLSNSVNIIEPVGKEFRIFNWITEPTDVGFRYYAAIQMPEEELKLYPLYDYSNEMKKGAQDSILTKGKWYGALIYNIVTKEKDGEKIYTLFGKNASAPISNKKVLDPMRITDDGVVFGMPIFKMYGPANAPGGTVNRFILEYKKEVQVSMNWGADIDGIYFDKLVSQVNDPNRKYTFVPSGQYDGFKWGRGMWNYTSNIITIDVREDGEAPTPQPIKGKSEN
ncbi:MAG: hypothetical protein R2800_05630 [Flavipsychrobacter sp.]